MNGNKKPDWQEYWHEPCPQCGEMKAWFVHYDTYCDNCDFHSHDSDGEQADYEDIARERRNWSRINQFGWNVELE